MTRSAPSRSAIVRLDAQEPPRAARREPGRLDEAAVERDLGRAEAREVPRDAVRQVGVERPAPSPPRSRWRLRAAITRSRTSRLPSSGFPSKRSDAFTGLSRTRRSKRSSSGPEIRER